MVEHPELSARERAGKAFPVSWDQFHRDCRALTWRLNEVGPFQAVIAITRGGLVPAAIVARELGLRVIMDSSQRSANYATSPIRRNCPDISRLAALGWRPDIGIEDGFRRTLASYAEKTP